MPTVKIAATDEELLACSEVILFLRPFLQKDELLPQIKEMQAEKYEIAYITAEDDPSKVVAFAGFRHMNKLFTGVHIYIDDLACLPAYQGRGYAGLLLDHVKALAKSEGLRSVQLDSGHALHPAHKVYHRQGYHISAHHFTQPL
ncbi:GNAT family N-acetyltransferase [Chitinophaga arvensicola]|uniref:Ribosomal protein S18 acetylase RimI n=1 Tax=Chitinophaga arvensicola TaxID=29529 RepID=A0A1I0SBG3_9BACT|nr:GNAT family N-acetyltransferase [Chitinophaga arvensicola]SEW54002.1 Ribosomal protein S18 acetylase RimI [Chitinophaga arvensicola]